MRIRVTLTYRDSHTYSGYMQLDQAIADTLQTGHSGHADLVDVHAEALDAVDDAEGG